jgi:2-methylcitrate dehydratase
MAQAEELASFIVRSPDDNISAAARQDLKVQILDALGSAIAAMDGEPVRRSQPDRATGMSAFRHLRN